MTVKQVKEFLAKYDDNLEIELMIETTGDNQCQYLAPMNDMAYASCSDPYIVFMHEAWGPKK